MKVNLGCGTNALDGWENLESSLNARLAKMPRVRMILHRLGVLPTEAYEVNWESVIDLIRIHDVTEGLPFPNDSVDYIYSSHMVEHISRDEFDELCQECYRVLRPGGWVRLSTPDLKIYIDQYGEDFDADDFINRTGLGQQSSNDLLDVLFNHIMERKHKWLYDETVLRSTLKEAGFDEIHRRQFQVGKVPDIEKLDNRESQSIFIEAQK